MNTAARSRNTRPSCFADEQQRARFLRESANVPLLAYMKPDTLDQGEFWFDSLGQEHSVSEMSMDALVIVISLLEGCSTELYIGQLVLEAGERAAGTPVQRAWAATGLADPFDWLGRTPLMRALVAAAEDLIARGGES